MDKAKAAVSDFMSKAGHHDTTVHETVAPAVQNETIKPHQHENVQTVVDKEVHQDHYHRTVQPIHDREVLPEQHTANLGAVQHREFDHRDADHTRRTLEADQAQFRDKSVTHDTTHSQSAAPNVGGEHIHHHIHETIQPVVHKETIQPHVVHTTVPIHEVHHHSAKHHDASTLPPVTMDEFKAKGGVLGGREERYDGFEGEPRNIGGTLSSEIRQHEPGHKKHDSHHVADAGAHRREGNHDGVGELGRGSQYGDSNTIDSSVGRDERRAEEGVRNDGVPRSAVGNTGTTGGVAGGVERGLEKEQRHEGGIGHNSNQTMSNTPAKKPSLLDKLNPKVDSNGDGKAGFMK